MAEVSHSLPVLALPLNSTLNPATPNSLAPICSHPLDPLHSQSAHDTSSLNLSLIHSLQEIILLNSHHVSKLSHCTELPPLHHTTITVIPTPNLPYTLHCSLQPTLKHHMHLLYDFFFFPLHFVRDENTHKGCAHLRGRLVHPKGGSRTEIHHFRRLG